jgi:hypothetical protein
MTRNAPTSREVVSGRPLAVRPDSSMSAGRTPPDGRGDDIRVVGVAIQAAAQPLGCAACGPVGGFRVGEKSGGELFIAPQP